MHKQTKLNGLLGLKLLPHPLIGRRDVVAVILFGVLLRVSRASQQQETKE